MSLTAIADKYCPSIARPMLNRVQRSTIARKIASGTFWSVVGKVCGSGFKYFIEPLTVRELPGY